MDIATEAAKFGPYAFFLAVFILAFFGAGKWVLDRFLTVVENNTKAITNLCQSSDRTTDSLAVVDQRAERIEASTQRIEQHTQRIVETTDRIERRLDVPRSIGRKGVNGNG